MVLGEAQVDVVFPFAVPFAPPVPPHTPLEHFSPEGHTTPHAPQFLGAMAVFTQRAPHCVWGEAHVNAAVPFAPPVPPHTPFEHFSPAGHITPHAPQFLGAMAVFTQRAPHIVCGDGQVDVAAPFAVPLAPPVPPHTPFEHFSPAEQTTPHAPQFLGAIAVFTQRAPHIVWGAGQVDVAVPFTGPLGVPFTGTFGVPFTGTFGVPFTGPLAAPVPPFVPALMPPFAPAAVPLHAPSKHAKPAPQETPQTPQLSVAVRVFTHRAPHMVAPVPQLDALCECDSSGTSTKSNVMNSVVILMRSAIGRLVSRLTRQARAGGCMLAVNPTPTDSSGCVGKRCRGCFSNAPGRRAGLPGGPQSTARSRSLPISRSMLRIEAVLVKAVAMRDRFPTR